MHQDFGRLAERFPSLCLHKLVQRDPDLKPNLDIYDLWMTSLAKSPLDQCCIHVDQVLSIWSTTSKASSLNWKSNL